MSVMAIPSEMQNRMGVLLAPYRPYEGSHWLFRHSPDMLLLWTMPGRRITF